MNKTITVTISVIILVVVAGAGWYFFGNSSQSQIDAAAAEIQQIMQERSEENQRALHYELKELDLSTVQDEYPRTEAVGIFFATPWGAGEVTDDRETAAMLEFPNGQEMVIMSSSRDADDYETSQDFLMEMDEDQLPGQASSLELFTDKLGEGFSEYEMMKYVFSVTPDDVAAAATSEEAQLRAYAIILKAGNMLSSTAQVYHFQTDYAEGFWSSSPQGESLLQVWTHNNWYGLSMQDLDSGNAQEVAEVIAATLRPIDGAKLPEAESDNSTDNYFGE
ncbi:MAG: hypothetical protein WD335_00255 [Candidatus Paceibacterota bacterium]